MTDVIDVTRYGTTAQKKHSSVMSFEYSDEFLFEADKKCAGTNSFLVCNLPKDAVIISVCVVTEINYFSSVPDSFVKVKVGTDTGQNDIMKTVSLSKNSKAILGSLVLKNRTGNGMPIFVTIVASRGITVVPKFNVVIEYLEYTKSISEYINY